ncbi:MAG TPA: glutamine amidotransferase, partial [Roseiflexaceae bacterium]|nr:glutamine amidotransferase [Roseiflexaceae bacterium]
RLEAPGDAQAQNNVAEAYSFVSGRPRVLLVEGAGGEAAALERALKAAQVEVRVATPETAPGTLAELSAFDTVALVNVPERALPEATGAALASFVHDLGHGLVMVGGPQSFGAGGWRGTPVEGALPVTMDIPPRHRLPPTSVVVVIDISGSMAEEENGRTKLSLAVEGAQRIAALLRDEDELTVIPFDNEPRFVVGPLPGSRREEAIEALNRVELGGGGINIRDALTAAAGHVRRSTRPARHIITITDGDDTTQQGGALDIVRALGGERVTLSSIAIGDGAHIAFIQSMARAGGGRYFFTDRATTLPDILVDEAQSVIQPYVVEGTFTPVPGPPHPALRSFGQAPPLRGFVTATPRQTAQVLLATPDGSPLLAAWQHGLGRSLAWTSDFTGRWAPEWVEWEEFPRLSAQLINWTLPAPLERELALETSVAGGELTLTARVEDAEGRPRSGLTVTASLLGADGARGEVELRELRPGEYRATVRDRPAGAYLVQLVAQGPDGRPVGSLTAGAVVPLSAEYRARTADPALLEELVRISGGRLSPAPAEVFAPNAGGRGAVQEIGLPLLWLALALLPLDIALRRLMPARDQVAGALRRLGLRRLAQRVGATEGRPRTEDRGPKTEDRAGAERGPATEDRRSSEDWRVLRDPSSSREAELQRLREAQEQARRRLRGEE